MAANVLHNNNLNPYDKAQTKQNIVIFSSSRYHTGLLMIMSPIGLRVMVALAAKLNSEGYSAATLDELARSLQTPRSYVNKGILILAKYDLIKKKRRGQYWINPAVFRPAVIEL